MTIRRYQMFRQKVPKRYLEGIKEVIKKVPKRQSESTKEVSRRKQKGNQKVPKG
jgi:hypothetical protein